MSRLRALETHPPGAKHTVSGPPPRAGSTRSSQRKVISAAQPRSVTHGMMAQIRIQSTIPHVPERRLSLGNRPRTRTYTLDGRAIGILRSLESLRDSLLIVPHAEVICSDVPGGRFGPKRSSCACRPRHHMNQCRPERDQYPKYIPCISVAGLPIFTVATTVSRRFVF